MNPHALMSDFDLTQDDHKKAIDNTVSVAMYDRAAQIERGSIASLINDCRLGAIQAMQAAKPELAAAFIHLGAELMATAGEEVVINVDIAPCSKAIPMIANLV